MANLWIYRSSGLDVNPPIYASPIPYGDDESVTVTCTPQIGWEYDYCTVVRDTIPPTVYTVYDSAVTLLMDIRTTLTFVGHAVGAPPPPPPPTDGVGFNPALLLMPVGAGIAAWLIYKYL